MSSLDLDLVGDGVRKEDLGAKPVAEPLEPNRTDSHSLGQSRSVQPDSFIQSDPCLCLSIEAKPHRSVAATG